jgi:hypothetical protein
MMQSQSRSSILLVRRPKAAATQGKTHMSDKNPTPSKPDLDNRSNQLNKNNPEYQRSRGQQQPQPQNPPKK